MTINNQSKAAVEAAKSLPDMPASPVALRAPCNAGTSAAPVDPRNADADSEVLVRARRRHFTNADKRRIRLRTAAPSPGRSAR
jgi:hypothetical protein